MSEEIQVKGETVQIEHHEILPQFDKRKNWKKPLWAREEWEEFVELVDGLEFEEGYLCSKWTVLHFEIEGDRDRAAEVARSLTNMSFFAGKGFRLRINRRNEDERFSLWLRVESRAINNWNLKVWKSYKEYPVKEEK